MLCRTRHFIPSGSYNHRQCSLQLPVKDGQAELACVDWPPQLPVEDGQAELAWVEWLPHQQGTVCRVALGGQCRCHCSRVECRQTPVTWLPWNMETRLLNCAATQCHVTTCRNVARCSL